MKELLEVKNERFEQDKVFCVSWMLSDFCNYSCSYCPSFYHSSKAKFYDIFIYYEFIDYIKTYTEKNGFNVCRLALTGGEPTAYKDLFNIIEYFSKRINNIKLELAIGTNLSPSIKYWDRYLELVSSLDASSIHASYHHEFASMQTFVDTVKHIHESKKSKILVRKVVTESNVEDSICLYDKISAINVDCFLKLDNKLHDKKEISYDMFSEEHKIILQKIINDTTKKIHTRSETGIEYINTSSQALFEKITTFKNWKCNAGYQSIYVDKNGKINRCYSDFNGTIGNILDGSYKKYLPFSKCLYDKCLCSGDIQIPKYKEIADGNE